MQKIMIQITSGKGPAECCRVVACVQSLMLKDAKQQGFHMDVIEKTAGEIKGTLVSTMLMLSGSGLDSFLKEWTGTIQWTAQSPYRRYHKRKNWFIGVSAFDVKELTPWNLRDVTIETCRASGPGGQHVNKVETAVRAKHLPSCIQVLAMDTRSQLENKKICLERLQTKVMLWQTEQLILQQYSQWQNHQDLERGNPIKTIKGDLI